MLRTSGSLSIASFIRLGRVIPVILLGSLATACAQMGPPNDTPPHDDVDGPYEVVIKIGKDGSHSLHAGDPDNKPLPVCTAPDEGSAASNCSLFREEQVRILDTFDINIFGIDYEYNPECTVYVVTIGGKEYYYYSPPECAP